MVRGAAVFFALVLLAGGLQILPAWEYGRHAYRWTSFPDPLPWNVKVPYSVHSALSLQPSNVLGLIVPSMNGYTVVFMGATVIALVALSILGSFRNLYVRLFFTLGIGGLCLALGPYTPSHGVLYSLLPIVDKARTPFMGVVIINFSFSVLCAYGIDNLHEIVWRRRLAALLAIFGAGILALAIWVAITHMPARDERTILVGFYALATAGILAAPFSTPVLSRLLFALCLGQFAIVCGRDFLTSYGKEETRYLRKMTESADIVAFLRTRPQPLRVDVDENEIPYNFGDWYGVEQLTGYLASLSDNVYGQELHTERVQQLMGVGYYVGRTPKWAGQKAIFENSIGLKLFENQGTLARVRTVRQFKRLNAKYQLITFIANKDNDLSKTIPLLETPPQVGVCDGSEDKLQLLRDYSGTVLIRAKLQCRAMVVLADTNFPGWQVKVDGASARMYQPYGFLRGVAVDGGEHTIEMVYRPWSVIAGAAMSVLSGLVVLLLAWVDRR